MINRVQISHKNNEAEYWLSLKAPFLSIFIVTLLVLLSCSEITTENGQKSSQKMSPQLSQVLDKLESAEEDTQKETFLPARVDEIGRVQIYVNLNDFDQENLNILKAHRLEIEIYDEQQQIVQGWALPENIKSMSQFDFVKSIDLPKYGFTN
jgi:hypothetical protein